MPPQLKKKKKICVIITCHGRDRWNCRSSKAPFIWRKLFRVEGSPAYPSYAGRANFSYIYVQNLANRLHEKQKVGSARRETDLAGLPFCDGRVTLLAGPTFRHINTLARLAGSTQSRREYQSTHEHCSYWKVSSWLGQRG